MNEAKQHRWVRRPAGSNWGDFGPDDELGRLNLITPEVVRSAVAEVVAGRSFCLSLPLDYPGGSVLNPRRKPPVFQPSRRDDGADFYNYRFAAHAPGHTDVMSDDAVLLYTQYSTQWDSYAHAGQAFDADGDGIAESVYYNGFRAGRHILAPSETPDGSMGARRLGIETMAVKAIQSRGVLVDLAAGHGPERRMVGHAELMRTFDAQRVTVRPGDILCLHTGFAQMLLAMQGRPDERVHSSHAVLNGRDTDLLNWITDSGIAALVADNYAVEGLPSPPAAAPCAIAPLHEHCLFKLGLPLGELWYLTELADWLRARGRSRFLLTAPPLRLTGAVGSPVTPVATV